MDAFRYAGRDGRGRAVRGQLEASTPELALQMLHAQDVYPTRLRRHGRAPSAAAAIGLRLEARLPIRQLAVFVRQFGASVRAGIPVVRALHLLERGAGSRPAAAMAGRVAARVEAGDSLTAAFRPEAGRLPATFLPFLQAGESGGTLDEVLWRLADYYEAQDVFAGKIRSALAYPAVVGLLSIAVVFFLLVAVVPNFALLYSSFHAPLPTTTRVMLASGRWLSTNPGLGLAAVFAAALLAFLASRWTRLREALEPVRRRLPIFGQLALQGGLARFSRTLATLLRAGVPILEALAVAAEMLPYAGSRRQVEVAIDEVRRGGPLSEAMRRSPQDFPPLLVEMVAVGEESGQVDDMFDRAATFLERDVDATLSRLSVLLEPILVVLLGGVVGTIIASVLVPMYSLFGRIQ